MIVNSTKIQVWTKYEFRADSRQFSVQNSWTLLWRWKFWISIQAIQGISWAIFTNNFTNDFGLVSVTYALTGSRRDFWVISTDFSIEWNWNRNSTWIVELAGFLCAVGARFGPAGGVRGFVWILPFVRTVLSPLCVFPPQIYTLALGKHIREWTQNRPIRPSQFNFIESGTIFKSFIANALRPSEKKEGKKNVPPDAGFPFLAIPVL